MKWVEIEERNFLAIPIQKITSQNFPYRCFFFLVILCSGISFGKVDKDSNVRDKRQVNGLPLVYPYGATYKVKYIYEIIIVYKVFFEIVVV